MSDKVLAWHFLNDSGLLRDGTAPPADGLALIHKGPISICKSGLHASERLIDALHYAPGAILCRVDCEGIAAAHDDKLVCSKRTILWRMDATRTLHEFAIWCAEEALSRVANPDPRSLAAIEAKRQWLAGTITDNELAIKRQAAWAAAEAAAKAAEEAAAKAAAEAAAKAAAEAAAWAAEEAAAWAAEEAAAKAAAEAAWAKTRKAQSEKLITMIHAAKAAQS